MSEALSHSFLDVDVETGVDNGRLLAMLASHGEVLSKRYTDSRVIVHCRIPERAMSHLRGPDTQIRPHGRASSATAGNGERFASRPTRASDIGQDRAGQAAANGDSTGSAHAKRERRSETAARNASPQRHQRIDSPWRSDRSQAVAEF